MSSAGRHFSQIEPRVRYFIGIAAGVETEGNPVSNNNSAFYLTSDNTYPGATALAADLDPIADNVGITGNILGTLYKDMGRSITIVDSTGKHLALYRNVQIVSGANTEGVGGSTTRYLANYYVLVWSAEDPDRVAVARVG